jgi:hypothetical protein
MDYSLAKELKDAGFPQNAKSCDTHADINDSTLVERVVHPTLSELIEACPKQMGTATFVLGFAETDKRDSLRSVVILMPKMVPSRSTKLSGSTPLALNTGHSIEHVIAPNRSAWVQLARGARGTQRLAGFKLRLGGQLGERIGPITV